MTFGHCYSCVFLVYNILWYQFVYNGKIKLITAIFTVLSIPITPKCWRYKHQSTHFVSAWHGCQKLSLLLKWSWSDQKFSLSHFPLTLTEDNIHVNDMLYKSTVLYCGKQLWLLPLLDCCAPLSLYWNSGEERTLQLPLLLPTGELWDCNMISEPAVSPLSVPKESK